MSNIQVTLKRSLIGCTESQRSAVRCLGLKKPGQSIQLKKSAQVLGQLNKVKHLLIVREKK